MTAEDQALVAQVVVDLIESEQIELLELCGAFSVLDASRVIKAVAGRIPFGHVAYALKSVRERRLTEQSLRLTNSLGPWGDSGGGLHRRLRNHTE
jgi:hypothetical protein